MIKTNPLGHAVAYVAPSQISHTAKATPIQTQKQGGSLVHAISAQVDTL